jgi:hypothetical protein
MNRRDRSTEAALIVLALVILVIIAAVTPAHATDASDRDPLVKATTDFDAANKCALMHFPLMTRLGPKYVLCLDARVGVPNNLRVLDVDAVLRAKP